MTREAFAVYKQRLGTSVNDLINKTITEEQKSSLVRLLKVLDQYSFENRLNVKGLLSHTIVDSLELDHSLAEEFLRFDNDIR